MAQFPYNEPPHSPPEDDEFFLPCYRCGGEADAWGEEDEDEDGKFVIVRPILTCEYCGAPLCFECKKKSPFCSPMCEGEAEDE